MGFKLAYGNQLRRKKDLAQLTHGNDIGYDTLRAVFVRLLDKDGYALAEWMLLTNVATENVDTATIGL